MNWFELHFRYKVSEVYDYIWSMIALQQGKKQSTKHNTNNSSQNIVLKTKYKVVSSIDLIYGYGINSTN